MWNIGANGIPGLLPGSIFSPVFAGRMSVISERVLNKRFRVHLTPELCENKNTKTE